MEIAGLNSDLQQEYTRQREHLERNLATLKKKVVKESELHRTDYVRIMQVPTRALGYQAIRDEKVCQGPLRDHCPQGSPSVLGSH